MGKNRYLLSALIQRKTQE